MVLWPTHLLAYWEQGLVSEQSRGPTFYCRFPWGGLKAFRVDLREPCPLYPLERMEVGGGPCLSPFGPP